jgi:hypothetical protein
MVGGREAIGSQGGMIFFVMRGLDPRISLVEHSDGLNGLTATGPAMTARKD